MKLARLRYLLDGFAVQFLPERFGISGAEPGTVITPKRM
jgi:hypothetical protein